MNKTQNARSRVGKKYSEGITLPDGSIVPDTKRNRALINKINKIYNPFTKRWIEDKPENRKSSKSENLKT